VISRKERAIVMAAGETYYTSYTSALVELDLHILEYYVSL